MQLLRTFRGREPSGVEEGLRPARSLLVTLAMTGEHGHRPTGKKMMFDLNDVGLPVHASQARHQDVGPIRALTEVIVLSEYPHGPGIGEHRLDRLVPRWAKRLGRSRGEAADLKQHSALSVHGLASLDAPRAAERIRPFDIEENRSAEEFGAASARTARNRLG